MNTIQTIYQRIDQDLIDITQQRDDRDTQITQLQQDINGYRQQNVILQNHVNQLTQERDYYQQGYDLRGHLWYNVTLVLEEQSKLRRIFEVLYRLKSYRLEQQLQECKTNDAITFHLLSLISRRYKKWKQKCKTRENDLFLADLHLDRLYGELDNEQAQNIMKQQVINNLNQQIFTLQNNNPLINPNMADARRVPVLNLITPILARIPSYTGQCPPDEYIDNIIQSWSFASGHMAALNQVNADDFNDEYICTLLKSKMSGKYAPVPAQDPFNGNADINSPDSLRTWLRSKYRDLTIGTNQSALQALIQERFSPLDTADSYENRIRSYTHGMANEMILLILYSHLPDNLELRVRRAGDPANVGEFFTRLRNTWMERGGMLKSNAPQNIPIQNIPQNIYQTTPTKIIHTENSNAFDELEMIAMHLGYPDEAPRDLQSIKLYIEDQLMKQYGNTYNAYKQPNKKSYAVKNSNQKSARHCSICGKTDHTKRYCPKNNSRNKTTKK